MRMTTALLAATGLAFMALPAHAQLTTAQQTHCQALGVIYGEAADTEKSIVDMLKDSMGDKATADDKAQIKDFEDHYQAEAQVSDSLKTLYGDAPAPSTQELETLRNTPMDQLLDQAGICFK